MTLPLPVSAGRLGKIEKAVGKSKSTSGGYHPPAPVTTYDYYRYNYYTPSYSVSTYTPGLAGTTRARKITTSVTTGIQYFYDTKGDLDGFTGLVRWRIQHMALEGDFTRFREQVRTGNAYLSLYNFNLLAIIPLNRFSLDMGLGYTGIYGQEQFDGFGIVGGLDVRTLDPFVIYASGKLSLVHHTGVGDFRVGLKAGYACLEGCLGFRWLAVEGAPGLSGPVFGVNLHF